MAIGIDADTEGNGPVSLKTVDSCVSVSRDDVFDIDIFIRDVEELLAWQVYIQYDPATLEVVGENVEMFLAGNPGSSVLVVPGSVPDPSLYVAAAADTSDPPTPDSGTGVLLRLTLRALSSGISDIDLIVRDIDGDGQADMGPLLRNVDGDILGDTNGDSIFDGPIENAKVAVDTACDNVAPVASPAISSDQGGGASTVLIAIGVVIGAIALIAGAFLALRMARGVKPTPE